MLGAGFDLARIGRDLPVASAEDALTRALAGGAMVVTAPPGTGKTTFVPPFVANHATGRVIVTQPRRVAVRAAARRLAHLDGTPLGERVGFTVRGESQVSAATRIEAVTPGVLLRRLMADPELAGVGAVVLDEVHERAVDSDLLLGMLAEVRQLRGDLVVVAMSATIDATAIAALLGEHAPAPVVDIPSPLHPLEVRHRPGPGPRLDERGVRREFVAHVAATALAEQALADGDALVFLPGAREVDLCVRTIRDTASGVDVFPLHGQLPARDQDRALSGRAPGGNPRIIVSTALAESALTVPGVRLVVDAGLSREARRDEVRDMSGLVTVSASRASAVQRAGRAARQGPGRVVRAYTEAEYAVMPATTAPEITTADLTDAALLLAAWGTPGGDGLSLLTPPPAATMARATAELRTLGLTDDDGRPTERGRRVARMPVGPREAAALLAAPGAGVARADAAEIVAALAGGYRDGDADLVRLVRDLRRGGSPDARRWRADADRLARLAGASGERGAGSASTRVTGASARAVGIVTAIAHPSRIARRVASGSRTYLLASGTRAALPEGSPLADSEWVAVWEVQRAAGRAADGTGAIVRLAAPLDEADARAAGRRLIARTRTARLEQDRVRVREEEHLGAIALAVRPTAPAREDVVAAVLDAVATDGLAALPWSDAAHDLRSRLSLLHRSIGAPWPDVSDAALVATRDDWLAPALAACADGTLRRLDVTSALRGLLPWPEAGRLDELAPEHLAVPSGSRIRIRYPDPGDPDAAPIVAVKLQEAFGLAHTPRLVDGRVPVVFHLLSPARQPLAVTGDLASFWDGPYRDVRKQMRGRYPKHPWPEDPWTAPATGKTSRALRREQ